MAGRRPQRIRPAAAPIVPSVEDAATDRALRVLSSAVGDAQARSAVDPITADLAVGSNYVRHGLGRAPRFVQVTPTVADATFGWAWVKTSPHADRQVRIDVVGVAQPGAVVIVS